MVPSAICGLFGHRQSLPVHNTLPSRPISINPSLELSRTWDANGRVAGSLSRSSLLLSFRAYILIQGFHCSVPSQVREALPRRLIVPNHFISKRAYLASTLITITSSFRCQPNILSTSHSASNLRSTLIGGGAGAVGGHSRSIFDGLNSLTLNVSCNLRWDGRPTSKALTIPMLLPRYKGSNILLPRGLASPSRPLLGPPPPLLGLHTP